MNLPIDKLKELRHELHKNPELSGDEKETSSKIIKFAQRYSPHKIIPEIGGNGVAVIFDGNQIGKTVLIRCDLDALPIDEENDFEYKSVRKNIAHKCGHDGHMSIVSGLIPILSEKKPGSGKVVLLFQPAEETGQGAEQVINDKKFENIKPDFVFALHNLPGFEKNEIVISEKEFASASVGMIVKLTGKTSHAAEPEKGITPSPAVAELIQKLTALPENNSVLDFSLVTIIHTKIGERAFGTTPGYAELMATLRAYKNADMEYLINNVENLVKKIAEKNKLKFEIGWVEKFPATVNDSESVQLVKQAASENNFSLTELQQPFRWSEDFGHFTNHYKGAMFGLGAGKNHPQLHNPDYDFPDEIILTGTKMFYSIINKILNN